VIPGWRFYGYIACTYVAGIFLCVAPWSHLWQDNYFVLTLGMDHEFVSGWVRGAISGLGAVNLLFALYSIYGVPRRGRKEGS